MPSLIILLLVCFDVWNENLINDKKQILWLGITFGFIVVANVIFIPFAIKSNSDSKVNKMLKKSNSATVLNSKELEITQSGITDYGGDDNVTYPWPSIIEIREVNQYHYLYLDTKTMIILRRDMFTDDQQYQSFKKLIKENTLL